MGHSCGTLLTLVRHSCGTCTTLLWDTLVGHSCGTLLRDTLVAHSCRTLLWVTLMGHSCRTLLWDTLVGHSCGGHTHHATLPSSFAIPVPPNDARSNANPNVTATFTSTTTHNLPVPCTGHASFRVHTSNAHKVLRLSHIATSRFPAPATKIPLPHLKTRTKSCACREK